MAKLTHRERRHHNTMGVVYIAVLFSLVAIIWGYFTKPRGDASESERMAAADDVSASLPASTEEREANSPSVVKTTTLADIELEATALHSLVQDVDVSSKKNSEFVALATTRLVTMRRGLVRLLLTECDVETKAAAFLTVHGKVADVAVEIDLDDQLVALHFAGMRCIDTVLPESQPLLLRKASLAEEIVALRPTEANARVLYASTLLHLGRKEDALRAIKMVGAQGGAVATSLLCHIAPHDDATVQERCGQGISWELPKKWPRYQVLDASYPVLYRKQWVALKSDAAVRE